MCLNVNVLIRNEFATTTSELKLIESAATKGLTNPNIAIGTAIRLYNNENPKFLAKTSSPSGLFPFALDKILPPFVISHLRNSFVEFEKSLPPSRLHYVPL